MPKIETTCQWCQASILASREDVEKAKLGDMILVCKNCQAEIERNIRNIDIQYRESCQRFKLPDIH